MNEVLYEKALDQLKEILVGIQSDLEFERIQKGRDQVLERYGEIFALENLPQLSEQEFRSFLLYENNHHWDGIQRHGSRICQDMGNLRDALSKLLDNRKPIEERFNQALDQVSGMGKATATPILLVSYPDQYGVWNNISEEGLKRLEIWRDFDRGTSPGEKYARINQILNRLSADLEVDLWTLDTLWWGLDKEEDETDPEWVDYSVSEAQRFALERHLHDFLRDNWEKTPLGEEWELYQEPEDMDVGYEYPTGVGRIDLLAWHRGKSKWLVVELKRDQTSNSTVGQVLRYIGWVRRHLAEEDELVRGLIIARDPDEALLYALDAFPGQEVELQRYEVEFELFPGGLEMD